jgi:hypothetical protein
MIQRSTITTVRKKISQACEKKNNITVIQRRFDRQKHYMVLERHWLEVRLVRSQSMVCWTAISPNPLDHLGSFSQPPTFFINL